MRGHPLHRLVAEHARASAYYASDVLIDDGDIAVATVAAALSFLGDAWRSSPEHAVTAAALRELSEKLRDGAGS